MTTKVDKEEKLAEPPKKPEPKFDPSVYSCEIIHEKTTLEKANDRKLPSDAFNVTYVVEGETLLDVTRSSKMVNVLICIMIGMVKIVFRRLIMVMVQ